MGSSRIRSLSTLKVLLKFCHIHPNIPWHVYNEMLLCTKIRIQLKTGGVRPCFWTADLQLPKPIIQQKRTRHAYSLFFITKGLLWFAVFYYHQYIFVAGSCYICLSLDHLPNGLQEDWYVMMLIAIKTCVKPCFKSNLLIHRLDSNPKGPTFTRLAVLFRKKYFGPGFLNLGSLSPRGYAKSSREYAKSSRVCKL